jgi:hypothetical protein
VQAGSVAAPASAAGVSCRAGSDCEFGLSPGVPHDFDALNRAAWDDHARHRRGQLRRLCIIRNNTLHDNGLDGGSAGLLTIVTPAKPPTRSRTSRSTTTSSTSGSTTRIWSRWPATTTTLWRTGRGLSARTRSPATRGSWTAAPNTPSLRPAARTAIRPPGRARPRLTCSAGPGMERRIAARSNTKARR